MLRYFKIITVLAGLIFSAVFLGGSVANSFERSETRSTPDAYRYTMDKVALEELKLTPRYQDRITGRHYYVEGKNGDMFCADGKPKTYDPQTYSLKIK